MCQLEIQFCRYGQRFLINPFRKSWFSGSKPSGPYLVVHLLACRASEENWELSLWTHLFHDTDHDTDHYFTDLRDLRTELNDLLRISMISWRNPLMSSRRSLFSFGSSLISFRKIQATCPPFSPYATHSPHSPDSPYSPSEVGGWVLTGKSQWLLQAWSWGWGSGVRLVLQWVVAWAWARALGEFE